MDVYIDGRRIRTTALTSIGKGGEADIFDLGSGMALKLFKPPDHPDYEGDAEDMKRERRGAKERLALHQKKLRVFPKGLPPRVITPAKLATDAAGNYIHGYAMPLIGGATRLDSYSKRMFRDLGVPQSSISPLFRDLHATVDQIHKAGVVIGDFNDLNGLVKGDQVFLIDADSFQFGSFFCQVFTHKFVDPTLCDPKLTKPMLVKAHNENSDWYAFAVMVFQSFLFVDPYLGVYRPKDPAKRIPHEMRPLRRVTVFDPEVIYPKSAVHFKVLPDDLLHQFHQVFLKDVRGAFPVRLLETIQWQKCQKCGLEHARVACPVCSPGVQGIVRQTTEVKGTVTVTRIFINKGTVVHAACHDGTIRFLYHDSGQIRRENGEVVHSANLSSAFNYRIVGENTLVMSAQAGAAVFKGSTLKERVPSYTDGNMPMCDSNGRNYFWIQNGQIVRNGQFGPEVLGNVLAGQTKFWAGPKFGFGFYWAGRLRVNFVFDVERQALNDTVKLPPISGQLIDSTCYLSETHAWFLWTAQESGSRVNHCAMINSRGVVEALSSVTAGSDSWLGTIHAKCALGSMLLAATDDGIVQIKPDKGLLLEVKRFPDTEPYVDTSCSLFAGKDGLYVVTSKEIMLLKINR